MIVALTASFKLIHFYHLSSVSATLPSQTVRPKLLQYFGPPYLCRLMSLIGSGRPLTLGILLFHTDGWTDGQTDIVYVRCVLVMMKNAVRGQKHQSECSTQNLLIKLNKHTSTWYVNMSASQNNFTDS